MKISLSNQHRRIKPDLSVIRKNILRIFPVYKLSKGRVDIVFINDKQIALLAGRFRNSPHPTDVLAFGYGDFNLAGEIAISLDTAKRQAKDRCVRLVSEVLLLCIHGLWHISGQGDENFDDWCEMRIKEFETIIKIEL